MTLANPYADTSLRLGLDSTTFDYRRRLSGSTAGENLPIKLGSHAKGFSVLNMCSNFAKTLNVEDSRLCNAMLF